MSTLFLYLEDRRKTAGLFLLLPSETLIPKECVCVCVAAMEKDLADDESFGWKLLNDTHN